MIKTLSKVGMERTYLNIIKAMYDKLNASIIINGQKLQAFPLRLGTAGMFTFTTLTLHSTGNPSTAIRQEKEIKGIQIEKEEVRLSLFAIDLILYIENPKDSTKKLLELIIEFNKKAGYKINIQKSVAFLYARNELTEREINKTIPFIIVT